MKIHYNPALKKRSGELRRNSTLSEVLLWNEIKHGKIEGYDFHRQRPIDNYIVDFFCQKLKLVIEIDGDSHIGKEKYDEARQKKIESLGINFLRYSDLAVKFEMENVLIEIRNWIQMQTNIKSGEEN
jgi:very-short-patch-repair endonuclease